MIQEKQIMVSICCITYNHSQFIKETLNSFLNQEVNFKYEILIYDDASTDETVNIIKEFEAKHPQIIKPIFSAENQYSKGVRGMNPQFNYDRVNGKYVALCEGDDYWTDNKKLQKQVDFLEANKDFVFTCSGYNSFNNATSEFKPVILDVSPSEDNTVKGFEITKERARQQWLTKTLTTLFLFSAINTKDLTKYKLTRDVHLFYYLFKKGKGYYMKKSLGVYRLHEGGVHTSIDLLNRKHVSYLVYKELFLFNKHDKNLRKEYFNSLSYVLIHFDEKFGKKKPMIKELLAICKGYTEYRIAISLYLKSIKTK